MHIDICGTNLRPLLLDGTACLRRDTTTALGLPLLLALEPAATPKPESRLATSLPPNAKNTIC